MNDTEYPYKTTDLAAEFDIATKTVRKRAKSLGLGLDLGGRAGFRYSEADRQRLIESLRPTPPSKRPVTKTKARKRAAA